MDHSASRTTIGGAAAFERLRTRVLEAPAAFADKDALAGALALEPRGLECLIRTHGHRCADTWLTDLRVEAAALRLREHRRLDAGLAESLGFASPAQFERAFRLRMAATPAAYREWLKPRRKQRAETHAFELALPRPYRAEEVLAFHGRDPAGLTERVANTTISKALLISEGGAVLEITLGRSAQCRVHADRPLSVETRALLHAQARRLLGLTLDAAAFERHAQSKSEFAVLLARRRGLRLPLMADAFEGLCWAVIGQQINLAFATSLRHALIELCGSPVGHMRAHPTPAAVAALDASALTTQRYSRAKTRYLQGIAQAITDGALPLAALEEGSAVTAEETLLRQHGVGTWTARYTLMRGMGFADCAPVGDVALAAALERWRNLGARPRPEAVEALLAPYAPFRSLATCHLWASLRDRN